MELYRQAAGAYPRPGDLRDGRQEPRHRQPPGRPRRRGRGDGPLGLRPVRPEVLGRLPGLRGAPGGRGLRRAAGRAGPGHPAGRPARPRHLPRPRRRRGRAGAVPAGRPRGAGGGRGAGRRPPGRPRARSGGGTTSSRPSCGSRRRAGSRPPSCSCRSSPSTSSTRVDEAITRANDTPLGLTAGFFSRDDAEIDRFLSRIEAGVVYVNRRAGATTGAWPGVQPFGGWKGSGSGGKAGGGPYYLQQYLREQSRTIVEEQG